MVKLAGMVGGSPAFRCTKRKDAGLFAVSLEPGNFVFRVPYHEQVPQCITKGSTGRGVSSGWAKPSEFVGGAG